MQKNANLRPNPDNTGHKEQILFFLTRELDAALLITHNKQHTYSNLGKFILHEIPVNEPIIV